MKKSLLFAIIILGFAGASNAQVGGKTIANAEATATIVEALSMVNSQALSFGTLGTTGAPSYVTIGLTDNASGDANILSGGARAPKTAVFDIKGTAGNSFIITLPSSPTLLTESGGNTMSVDTWNTTLGLYSLNKSGVLGATDGKFALMVGATLHVGATQNPGDYTGTYSITVDYE